MSKTARRDLDSHSAFSGQQAAILTWREQRSEQYRVALERNPLRHLGMTTRDGSMRFADGSMPTSTITARLSYASQFGAHTRRAAPQSKAFELLAAVSTLGSDGTGGTGKADAPIRAKTSGVLGCNLCGKRASFPGSSTVTSMMGARSTASRCFVGHAVMRACRPGYARRRAAPRGRV
jgi:hypothetical protein